MDTISRSPYFAMSALAIQDIEILEHCQTTVFSMYRGGLRYYTGRQQMYRWKIQNGGAMFIRKKEESQVDRGRVEITQGIAYRGRSVRETSIDIHWWTESPNVRNSHACESAKIRTHLKFCGAVCEQEQIVFHLDDKGVMACGGTCRGNNCHSVSPISVDGSAISRARVFGSQEGAYSLPSVGSPNNGVLLTEQKPSSFYVRRVAPAGIDDSIIPTAVCQVSTERINTRLIRVRSKRIQSTVNTVRFQGDENAKELQILVICTLE